MERRYATIDEEKRIRATTIPMGEGLEPSEGQLLIDFPDDFNFMHQQNWKWINGSLVHDPLPIPEPKPDRIEQLEAQVGALERENKTLTQEGTMVMLAITEMFEAMMGGM